MINYSKARESGEKLSSKKSLTKGMTVNKSHTSSINVKLNNDPVYAENMKVQLKNLFKQKCEVYADKPRAVNLAKYVNSSQKQRFAIKLQNNENREHQNISRKKESTDRSALKATGEGTKYAECRAFMECNRYLETERYVKDPLKNTERSLSKQAGTKLKTEYIETSCDKYKREMSTKQTNTSSNHTVRVTVSELRSIVQQFRKNQREVEEMERELKFYRRNCPQELGNSVMAALRI